MRRSYLKPARILIVTPEIAYLPFGLATNARPIRIGSGVMAQSSAALVTSLFQQGLDVHVALPNYRRLFNSGGAVTYREGSPPHKVSNGNRAHLAQDRYFFYQECDENGRMVRDGHMSLVFQREVINHIIPTVRPDLIHCMDWTTGLIPAMLCERQIPCLFSFYNWATGRACLKDIEDRGIDAAWFWHRLYFQDYPRAYESVREDLPVDFLASGILASRHIWLGHPGLLQDILDESFRTIREDLKLKLINAWEAGRLITSQPTETDQVMAMYADILGRPLDYFRLDSLYEKRPSAPPQQKIMAVP